MTSWHVHLGVLLWLAGLQLAYLLALRLIGARAGRQATRGQIAWFSLGVLVLYAGAGGPLHDLSEQRLLSAHMIQHLLFTLIAPPLLLLGTPDWLLAALVGRKPVFGVFRLLTRPLVAFTIFNVALLLTHLPVTVDVALRHHNLHFLSHVGLTLTASLMWWPVFSQWPALPRLTPLLQMLYLFVQSFVPTVLASFLTFADKVLYAFYEQAPRTWGISAVDDQMIAGLTMKLVGGVILWSVIAVRFFGWVSRENRAGLGGAPAPLRWDEVEAELGEMGLTKTGASRSS